MLPDLRLGDTVACEHTLPFMKYGFNEEGTPVFTVLRKVVIDKETDGIPWGQCQECGKIFKAVP